jgi:hypothetical protein
VMQLHKQPSCASKTSAPPTRSRCRAWWRADRARRRAGTLRAAGRSRAQPRPGGVGPADRARPSLARLQRALKRSSSSSAALGIFAARRRQ